MRAGGGAVKGRIFENYVAKLIRTIAIKYGFPDDACCYRTPSSGGHRYAKKTDPGDLVFESHLQAQFPFLVECKNQKILDFEHFLHPEHEWMKTWGERQWLDQVHAALKAQDYQAAQLMRRPLLVFKKNKTPVYVAISIEAWREYTKQAKLPLTIGVFTYMYRRWMVTQFDFLLGHLELRLKACEKATRRYFGT